MRLYTTCPGCGDYILALGPQRRPTHALCTPPPDPAAHLEADFLAAAAAGDDDTADRIQASLDRLDQRDTTAPRLREAALAYANWGWPVFPLRPGQKTPYARSHGYRDATTDRDTVRTWWTRAPWANIGLATGNLFDVLDVDFKHGAMACWPDLRDSEAMPAVHGLASTASGGLHVFLMPAGLGNHTNMGSRPGLDYRGRGGYVVAAPSVLADRRRYMWTVPPSPLITRRAREEVRP